MWWKQLKPLFTQLEWYDDIRSPVGIRTNALDLLVQAYIAAHPRGAGFFVVNKKRYSPNTFDHLFGVLRSALHGWGVELLPDNKIKFKVLNLNRDLHVQSGGASLVFERVEVVGGISEEDAIAIQTDVRVDLELNILIVHNGD